MKRNPTKFLGLTAAMMIFGLTAVQAFAGALTLTFVPTTLINVQDAAGITQHEAGSVSSNVAGLAYYSLTRRITTGAGAIHASGALTLTIFTTSDPPDTITVQGAHSFNNGNETGSVSATSPLFKKYNRKLYNYDGTTHVLTITK